MLNRYRVRLIKKYDFDLVGRSEQDLIEQVSYIMTQTKILDIPYVRKSIKIKVKKIHERSNLENDKANY